MKRKNLISLSIACTFTTLSATGLLLYFGKKMHFVETIHVIFGLTFTGFAIFHISNNWSSLVSYAKSPGKSLAREFAVVLAGFAIVLGGAALELPPFAQITEAGKNLLRGSERREPRPERVTFDQVKSPGAGEIGVTIIIQRGAKDGAPPIAIWAADASGKFAATLFVPAPPEGRAQGDAFPAWKAAGGASVSENAGARENFMLATSVPESGQIFVEVSGEKKPEVYSTIVPARGGASVLSWPENLTAARAVVVASR